LGTLKKCMGMHRAVETGTNFKKPNSTKDDFAAGASNLITWVSS